LNRVIGGVSATPEQAGGRTVILTAAVRAAGKKSLLAAFLGSLLIFGSGAALGYTSISSDWAARSLTAGGAENPIFGGSFWTILIQNISAAMFLYSGVLTLGLTSVLAMGMVSAYIGATVAVGVHNVGPGQILGDTGTYVFLEFGGCIVAAAAGLYPFMVAVGAIVKDGATTAVFSAYLRAVHTSLKMFACAISLILIAAAIEATVIALR
jgi:uncharacterized membrane protein SpoIIM required for sporulation